MGVADEAQHGTGRGREQQEPTAANLVEKLEPLRACHYTGTAGLLAIIQTHRVRATSAAFMNDADEMRTGAKAFAEFFEQSRCDLTEDEIQHIERSGLISGTGVFTNFLLSAAQDPDSLTLWRNYGVSEVAYSIEFNTRSPLVPLEARPGESHPAPPPHFYEVETDSDDEGNTFPIGPDPDSPFVLGGKWQAVRYIRGSMDPFVVKHFDAVLSSYRKKRHEGGIWIPAFALSNSMLDFIKDAGFEDEDEVRSVHWVNPWWKFVKYRDSRFGVVPFIELTGSADDKRDYATEAHRLPITTVTIGPNAPQDAEHALREFLDVQGYGDTAVSRSITPYR